MQRCLQAWTPLPRARLQAAAKRGVSHCPRDSVHWLTRQRYSSTSSTRFQHDEIAQESSGSNDQASIKSAESDPWQRLPPSASVSNIGSSLLSDHMKRPRTTRPTSSSNREHPVTFGDMNRFWIKTTSNVRSQYEKELDQSNENAQRNDLDAGAEAWAELFMDRRRPLHRWQQAAIWLLENNKERSLDFLVATHHLMDIPATWVADTIRLLATYYHKQEEEVARPIAAKFAEALKTLTRRASNDPLPLKKGQLRLFLPHLTYEEIREVYGYITEGSLVVEGYSLIHLARTLAWDSDIASAVDAFIAALPEAVGWKHELLAKTVGVIVSRLVRTPDGHQHSIRLVQKINEFGVDLRKSAANYLIWNAYTSQQYRLAAELYRLLFERLRLPDKFTFVILLKVLKADGWAETGLTTEYIIDEAFRTGVVHESAPLAGALLQAYSTIALEDIETAWPQVCRFYNRLYNGTALELLDLPRVEDHAEVASQQLQPPSGRALAYMIQTYLTVHSQGLLQESDPVDVYNNFRSLVLKGEQPYLNMTTTPHVCNFFLHSFIKERETLINATNIMKDMQTPLPESLGVEQAKPSIWSWNIFQMGFRIHGKTELAEQVLHYMRDEGIEPNNVTWNQLIAAYADNQELEGLVGVLHRAADDGMEFDQDTEKGLSRFKDQQALHGYLRKSRVRMLKLDFSDDLKAGIASKLEAGNRDTG